MNTLDRIRMHPALVLMLAPPLFACLPFVGPGPSEEPPVDDEGCSDDHSSYWKPDPQGAQIEVEGAPASGDCNKTAWFSGGGSQGGSVFHMEPELRVTSDVSTLENATLEWWIHDLTRESTWNQGYIEIYDEDIAIEEDGFVVHPRLFIGPDDRGKNFILEMELAGSVDGQEKVFHAEAGVYVSQ